MQTPEQPNTPTDDYAPRCDMPGCGTTTRCWKCLYRANPCECKVPLAMFTRPGATDRCGECAGIIPRDKPARLAERPPPDHETDPEPVDDEPSLDKDIKRAEALAAIANTESDMPQTEADVYDATKQPGIHELPAQTTAMTPNEFTTWLETPGRLFIVYLPAQRTFIIKVPDEHHPFFVGMMKQLRLVLGPEVQAVGVQPVTPRDAHRQL